MDDQEFYGMIYDAIEDGLDLCHQYRAVKKRKPCIYDDLIDLKREVEKRMDRTAPMQSVDILRLDRVEKMLRSA